MYNIFIYNCLESVGDNKFKGDETMKLKTFFGVTILVGMIIGGSITSIAADDAIVTPDAVGTTVTHNWSFKVDRTYEETQGGWTHIYTGSPATRNGEYDSISHSTSYSHTYTGTIGGNLKGGIQAQLGYSFGKTVTFGISKNSGSLKKGEYVKAYYQKNFDVSKIQQTDLKRTTGYILSGGQYRPVDRIETITSYVYAKKAIQPKIKLEYWANGNQVRSDSAGHPTHVEYYEFINGQYCQVGSN